MLVDFFTFLISLFPALGEISYTKPAPVATRQKTPLVLQQKDFHHTFAYKVFHGTEGMSCQATRINPRWFVTAAHCVKDVCRKSCTIEMDLMDTAVSAKVIGHHDQYRYSVFVHPGYKKTKAAKDDFALIRLDVKNESKQFYRRRSVQHPQDVRISGRQFFAWLRARPVLYRQDEGLWKFTPPEIVEFEGGDYEILRTLSVVSILNGKRTIKQNKTPVYYVKNLGYAYTQDFGIHKGMSGSGVISDKRELVGIISANVKENYFKNNRQVFGRNWFMFPVFNEEVIAFMKAVMGDEFNTLKIKPAYPSVVRKTNRDFSSISKLVSQARKR